MTKCKKCSVMLPEIENIGCKQCCRTPKTQGLAWPGVEIPGNRIQLFLSEATQVAPSEKLLPHQAAAVLVASPGTVRISKGYLHPGRFSQPLMRCHFPALIVSQRKTLLRLDTIEHRAETAQSGFGAGLVHPGERRKQGGALSYPRPNGPP